MIAPIIRMRPISNNPCGVASVRLAALYGGGLQAVVDSSICGSNVGVIRSLCTPVKSIFWSSSGDVGGVGVRYMLDTASGYRRGSPRNAESRRTVDSGVVESLLI